MPNHAPVAFVTNAWRRLVFDKDGGISRAGYTLCLMDRLQDALRRPNIYVGDLSLDTTKTPEQGSKLDL